MTDQINFDDLNPTISVLSNQYASRGVIFNPPLPVTFTTGAGGAPRFLVKSVFAGGSLNDRSSHEIAGTLTDSRHSLLGVQVGRSLTGFETPITLRAYDVARNLLQSITITVPANQTFSFGKIEVSAPSISFFVLERIGNATADFFMNFLEFDDPRVPHRPDFRLIYSGGDLFLRPGADILLEIKILRLYGSHGDVSVRARGGPPGLAITMIAPDPVNAINHDTTTIGVLINANAQEAPASPTNILLITGVPDPTSGDTDVIIQIPVSILESFDLQIAGMEITQGIQEFDLPVKADQAQSGVVTYNGVNLASNCRTAVRVFPTFGSLPSGPLPISFGVRLNGISSNGATLPGSPLLPEQLSSQIFAGNTVTPTIRVLSASRFTLPPAWTNNVIDLEAEIFDNNSSTTSSAPAPVFEINPNNNSFRTNGIRFFRTENLYITPIPLTINNVAQPGSGAVGVTIPGVGVNGLSPPLNVFSGVKKLFPVDAGKLVIVPYQATLNVTGAFLSSGTPGGRAAAIIESLLDAADSRGLVESQRSFTVGVFSALFFAITVGGSTWPPLPNPQDSGVLTHFNNMASIVQDTGRPLTGVAHEVSHLCGRVHASTASLVGNVLVPTGAQAPTESWPPDQLGFLQGVGFDTTTANVIYPQRFGHPETSTFTQFFDFMSYGTNTDSNAWISPRGWDETLQFLRPYSETHPEGLTKSVEAKKSSAPLSATIRIRIESVTGRASIQKIGPVENSLPMTALESPYNIVLKARNLTTIVAKGQPVVLSHNEALESTLLQATIPIDSWDAIGSVEVCRDDKILMTRVRPAHSPTITNLAINPSTTEPSETSSPPPCRTITWTTTHQSALPLSAHISYLIPADRVGGSSSWKHIYSTTHLPSHAEILSPLSAYTTGPLPPSHFPHNAAAQVRLTVSDGFNVTTSLSDPFVSLGSPPLIDVVSPRSGEELRAGCNVYLHAEIYDDWGGKVVDEESVKWIVDGEVVARGAVTSWKTEVDASGRKAVMAVGVDYLGRESVGKVEFELVAG
ncbi:hypothetical protein MMC11_006670 [Xylographa trunciseda]|nr:hypothetical protein [Xylographa trunciseda]